MFIQFDGDITDLATFEHGLQLVGLFPLSVRLSRWIRTDPETLVESDAGPRIDIELFRQARPFMLPNVQALQAYVDASPYVVRPGPAS
jgi:hypothetical protein